MSKMKITIEQKGHPAKVFEADGFAAALLKNCPSIDEYGIQVCVCGSMTLQDLYHLNKGVENDLTETMHKQLVSTAIEDIDATELFKRLFGGENHGADR